MSDARLARTRAAVVGRLLDERNAAGIWEGELSSSALSTTFHNIETRSDSRLRLRDRADLFMRAASAAPTGPPLSRYSSASSRASRILS